MGGLEVLTAIGTVGAAGAAAVAAIGARTAASATEAIASVEKTRLEADQLDAKTADIRFTLTSEQDVKGSFSRLMIENVGACAARAISIEWPKKYSAGWWMDTNKAVAEPGELALLMPNAVQILRTNSNHPAGDFTLKVTFTDDRGTHSTARELRHNQHRA